MFKEEKAAKRVYNRKKGLQRKQDNKCSLRKDKTEITRECYLQRLCSSFLQIVFSRMTNSSSSEDGAKKGYGYLGKFVHVKQEDEKADGRLGAMGK